MIILTALTDAQFWGLMSIICAISLSLGLYRTINGAWHWHNYEYGNRRTSGSHGNGNEYRWCSCSDCNRVQRYYTYGGEQGWETIDGERLEKFTLDEVVVPSNCI